MPLIASICDRLIALDQGRVISVGDPATVLEDPLVVGSYLGSDRAAIERSGAGVKVPT
jgi:ABC-type branched-subunit amino acid transport system ATPase component